MVCTGIAKCEEMNFTNEIECGIDALLKYEAGLSKKNVLLNDGKTIFLYVSTFKVPQLKEFVKRRIPLKHCVYGENPEVCLIVRDRLRKDHIKRTKDEMIDYTIEKYEELLQKHKITGISKILPFEQLKTEYDTYELRRKLVNQFDIFLCTSYLLSRDNFFKCLGKIFMKKCKYPISVKLPGFDEDFNANANLHVQRAIASSVYYIKTSSDNYCIRVGNTNQKRSHLIENLNILINAICESDYYIPGGFQNIRSMSLKTEKSKLIPLYMSLASAKDIPQPQVKLNVTMQKSVEGEITTVPGKKVTVLPSGRVIVGPKLKKSGNDNDESESNEDAETDDNTEIHNAGYEEDEDEDENEDDDEDEDEDDDEDDDDVNDEDEDMRTRSRKTMATKANREFNERESDDEDESEDEENAIESAEQKYLLNLQDEYESSDYEEEMETCNKTTRKEKKIEDKTIYKGVKRKQGDSCKREEAKKTKINKSKNSNRIKKTKRKN